MSDLTCSVDDCDEDHYARGLCRNHYQRQRLWGSTDVPPQVWNRENWPLWRTSGKYRRRGFGAFCRGCRGWFVARITNRKAGGDFYCGNSCKGRASPTQFSTPTLLGSGRYKRTTVNGEFKWEHRWVAEQALGRELATDEHVHHINGDKADNDPENLVVLSAKNHALLHRGEAVQCLDLQGRKCVISGRQCLPETEGASGLLALSY